MKSLHLYLVVMAVLLVAICLIPAPEVTAQQPREWKISAWIRAESTERYGPVARWKVCVPSGQAVGRGAWEVANETDNVLIIAGTDEDDEGDVWKPKDARRTVRRWCPVSAAQAQAGDHVRCEVSMFGPENNNLNLPGIWVSLGGTVAECVWPDMDTSETWAPVELTTTWKLPCAPWSPVQGEVIPIAWDTGSDPVVMIRVYGQTVENGEAVPLEFELVAEQPVDPPRTSGVYMLEVTPDRAEILAAHDYAVIDLLVAGEAGRAARWTCAKLESAE